MAEHAALKKALRQMAEGSKSAFHTFYLGSSQYVYSSALLLYDSHEDACRFMVDFYEYLYLHLPEYDRSQSLENWISHLMMERYEQLSIGKNMKKPSVKQQMNSTTVQLSKSEQERVWRMLDVNIHFPKETSVRHIPGGIVLLISVLLLLLLVASRYVPAAFVHLKEAASTAAISGEAAGSEGEGTEDNTADPENEGAADDGTGSENAGNETDNADQADELNSIKDELNDLLNQRADTDAGNPTDDTDGLLQQQQSTDFSTSGQTKTPESPAAPDTPQEPDPPQTPQEPVMSENSDTLSGTEDLEDLELELYYGDNLRF